MTSCKALEDWRTRCRPAIRPHLAEPRAPGPAPRPHGPCPLHLAPGGSGWRRAAARGEEVLAGTPWGSSHDGPSFLPHTQALSDLSCPPLYQLSPAAAQNPLPWYFGAQPQQGRRGSGGQASGGFLVMEFIWVWDLGVDMWVHTCGCLTALPPTSLSSSRVLPVPCPGIPRSCFSDHRLQWFQNSALQFLELIP